MNGIRLTDLPINDYHGPQSRKWLTNTALKHAASFRRGEIHWTPSHFKAYMSGESPAIRSEALVVGSAFHAMTEGRPLDEVAIIIPKGIRRNSAAYKEWYATQIKKHGVTKVAKSLEITSSQESQLRGSYKQLLNSKLAQKIFAAKKVAVEGTIRWKDAATGLDLQSRPDLETDDIVDWKTDRDPHTFIERAYGLGYHRSGAMQRQAVFEVTGEMKRVLHVVVGKKAPFDVCVYELPETALELGWREVRKVLGRVAEWLEGGVPESPWETDIIRRDLPAWCYRDADETDIPWFCGSDEEYDDDESEDSGDEFEYAWDSDDDAA